MNTSVENFKKQQQELVIVTGLSGAGKSSVMRALEDYGFYCVDNLPLPLLSPFISFAFNAPTPLVKVAVGIDSRSEKFLKGFLQELQKIRQGIVLPSIASAKLKVVFVTSSEEVIIKRFQETRRKHPLERGISIKEAISKENELLNSVKKVADVVLDTDTLTIHDLRRWIQSLFALERHELVVNLISFGFKYGIPLESNLMYDLRFLPNPYFIPELRFLDGRSEKIKDFLFHNEEVNKYWSHLEPFLHYSLEKSYEEGRFFVNVALGCTGGRHRSVAFVEMIAKKKWNHMKFVIHHRDIGKG